MPYLTDDKINKLNQKLDEWTTEDAELIFNRTYDDIGIIRVFKSKDHYDKEKNYTLLRCFWINNPALSCDKQDVDANEIIKELGTHLGKKV